MATARHAAIAALVAVAMLPGEIFGQINSGQHINLPSCASVHRSGRRIVSNLELVEFYVPRFAHVVKSRDVDYVEYHVRFGPERDKLWLKFMFGGLVGGQSPDDLGNTSITWTAQKWGCHQDEDGTDWRGVAADGRRWRHVAIPFGFAVYKNLPAKAANYFDKILDTMCCGKRLSCKT